MDERVPKPLPIGTRVPKLGKVAAVVLTNGERYYMLTKAGTVSLMDWFTVHSMLADSAGESRG